MKRVETSALLESPFSYSSGTNILQNNIDNNDDDNNQNNNSRQTIPDVTSRYDADIIVWYKFLKTCDNKRNEFNWFQSKTIVRYNK